MIGLLLSVLCLCQPAGMCRRPFVNQFAWELHVPGIGSVHVCVCTCRALHRVDGTTPLLSVLLLNLHLRVLPPLLAVATFHNYRMLC
jgi:hypothetical protein